VKHTQCESKNKQIENSLYTTLSANLCNIIILSWRILNTTQDLAVTKPDKEQKSAQEKFQNAPYFRNNVNLCAMLQSSMKAGEKPTQNVTNLSPFNLKIVDERTQCGQKRLRCLRN
jgi:hypothetical protein